jgi:hypothetical protein
MLAARILVSIFLFLKFSPLDLGSPTFSSCWLENSHTVDPEIGIPAFPSLRERIEMEGKVEGAEEVEKLHSFLKACWTLDHRQRPSPQQLLAHEWLREVLVEA